MYPGLAWQYEDKLIQLNLPSLGERRTRGDMIQTFKIIHKFDNVDPNTWFQFKEHRPTRGNTCIDADGVERKKLTLEASVSHTEVRRNFFSNRVVGPWNELPEQVRCMGSVNSFKNAYDKSISG